MNEKINEKIKELSDISVKSINAMSNRDVAYSNINYLFRRDCTLLRFAIACVNILEDEGIDSRALSFAFSNSFSDRERCSNTPTKILLDDGKYIIDVPRIVIERAMLWLTEQEIIDRTHFSPDMKIGVPQKALQQNSAFDEFLRGKKKK